ncbi:hypothetical protein scyTo_0013161 [Scyliorhinus torazame]|uniref:Hemicentin-1 n=1 Tax=Scyliorhinus torazame TaxID=75743 RepID=A0A401NQP5_SCYTO|nr:hypothetical protein [Scyliorhinus torazame]
MKEGVPVDGAGSVLSDGEVLRIESVQAEDAGLYTCLATNPVGEDQLQFVVRINVPPHIMGSNGIQMVALLADEQLTLECESEADPPPDVQWFKNNVPLQANAHIQNLPDSQFLLISNVAPADAGDYRCLATNIAGQVTRTFNVVIHVTPTIAASSPSLSVFINQVALLECEAQGIPKPTVTWRKNGNSLAADSSRFDFLSEGSLRIRSVQASDSGRYLCTASNAVGTDHHRIELQVLGAPTISPAPTNVTALANLQAELTCEVSGTPKPEVTWKKNGKPLNFDLQQNMYRLLPSGSLAILSATTQDTASYECVASNEAGDSRRLIQFTVHVPPSIADDSPDVTVTKMSSVMLTCHVTGIPEPAVSWMKDGARMGNRGPGYKILPTGNLEITAAALSHAGSYICTARNVVGTSRRHVTLKVQEPPVIKPLPTTLETVVNEGIVLPCESTGFFLLANGGLEIARATEEDSGNYRCIAQNEVGTALGKTQLVVQVPPVIKAHIPPVIKAHSREYKATFDRSATLPCEAEGHPKPEVTWVKDGHAIVDQLRLQMFVNGSLRIPGVQLTDAGWYTCIARNRVGVVSTDTILVVQVKDSGSEGRSELITEKVSKEDSGTYVCTAENAVGMIKAIGFVYVKGAPVFTVEPLDTTVGVGDRVSLHCQAEGEPLPAVEWTKNGHPVRENEHLVVLPNATLQILSTAMEDTGEYECVARNLMGSSFVGITLTVQVHGEFSGWLDWGPCSATCGQGIKERIRLCNNPLPANGGRPCRGWDVESRQCNSKPCSVDGQWTVWNSWSRCSASCGGGARQRSRSCFDPPPQHGGRLCEGSDVDVELCKSEPCPVNGNWGPWNPWNLCSQTCGGGQSKRSRSCSNPPPASGGKVCLGANVQMQRCGMDLCPGPLASVLVSIFTPVYWSVAHPAPGTVNGFSLTEGVFRQESQMEFATGEILRLTHIARGVDTEGALLFDIVINGYVPRTIASADVTVKDFSENYVQTGPGQIYAWSTQTFFQGGSPLSFQCNHTVEYESGLGRQPSFLQILRAEYISVHYGEETEELSFQITTSFQQGSNVGHCPGGFVLDAASYCTDIDECQLGTHMCHFGQDCQNEAGSYRCLLRCGAGFKPSSDGAHCEDVNECEQSASPPCLQRCLNAIGTYRCGCEPGYQLRGQHCVDINECSMNVCRPDQQCQNTEGGYLCTGNCPHGTVRLLTGTCGDVDECKTGDHLCRYNQVCENTAGSYYCSCRRGYRSQGMGRPCLDIDECQEQNIKCGLNQMCFNTRGSHQCINTPCPATYRRGTRPGTCFRRCILHCSAGPLAFQYKLLTLPRGISAKHDVVRLSAFSERGELQSRTNFTAIEQDATSPFAIRTEEGRGIVHTLRPLAEPGVYRLKVRAATYSEQWTLKYQSVFVIVIAVSPYPY